MKFENLTVEIDGPVATITLNRPDKLNALSAGLQADYDAALTALAPGDSVRVIRLRGAGRAFCSGYDISGPGDRDRAGYGPLSVPRSRSEANGDDTEGDARALAGYGQSFALLEREGMRQQAERWLRIWNYRKPVIAQVHGYCLSGGLDLLATTDLAFAAAGTRFGHPAARGVGIPVLMGMLPLKIGVAKTKRILFTGDLIDADTALDWGLVEWVVDPAELDQRAMEYCQRAAMLPMDALTIHKQAVNRWSELAGARVAALEMVDMDALYHTTPAYHEFNRRIMEHGLQHALAWRDGPFRQS
ncbi:MAG TPA: enoyl-CoA hydratase-related protein [Streptosporangiaceae bacterium]|nr:enoyl-CoA hydratase-related protein [Streptosporangiaceae bacterium]